MKIYSFVEPLYGCSYVTLEVVMTEDEIIDFYYDYWSNRLEEIGKADQISRENCIEDFIIGHWAIKCEDIDFTTENGTVRMDYKMWTDYHKWIKENNQ